jgi:ABC-2 type transport system ATP-binding protein
MLTFDSVTRSFGSVPALSRVSFGVPGGAVVGLVGHNGAGKTTLMKTVTGLVRPDAGEVRLHGTPVGRLGRLGGLVGVSFDASTLPPAWTVGTALRAAADLSGVSARKVPETLELVGLGDVARRRIGALSMGMRQRLALAIALVGRPMLLVLDEPTNALDPAASHELRGWLRAHAAAGNSVLVSSHNLPEVEQVADRIVVMRKGQVVQDAATADLLAAHTVLARVDRPQLLAERLARLGRRTEVEAGDVLRVFATSTDDVGQVAADCNVVVRELYAERRQLSDVYHSLTTEGAAR